ncbi:hypothetical protein KA005_47790 [bacterium]|nr:hypothetical protein [bacterium]
MVSVKSILNCIGVDTSASVSILGNMFGFIRRRVPNDPCSTDTAQVSLLNQVRSLQGRHVHLNIIRVGIDNFTNAEIDRIEYAIYKVRNIFNTQNLGIGRVEHYNVTSGEAGGKDNIGSEDEAEDLTDDWTVPNDGIDVFMVDNISADFVGMSPVDGPCDKNDKDMNGVIGGEVGRNASRVARTFAHEIGHYLGLRHTAEWNDDISSCQTLDGGTPTTAQCNNLMAQTACATSCGSGVCQAMNVTGSQGSTIRSHCFVKSGC